MFSKSQLCIKYTALEVTGNDATFTNLQVKLIATRRLQRVMKIDARTKCITISE